MSFEIGSRRSSRGGLPLFQTFSIFIFPMQPQRRGRGLVLFFQASVRRTDGLVGSARLGGGSRRGAGGTPRSDREADEHHRDALPGKGRGEEVLSRVQER